MSSRYARRASTRYGPNAETAAACRSKSAAERKSAFLYASRFRGSPFWVSTCARRRSSSAWVSGPDGGGSASSSSRSRASRSKSAWAGAVAIRPPMPPGSARRPLEVAPAGARRTRQSSAAACRGGTGRAPATRRAGGRESRQTFAQPNSPSSAKSSAIRLRRPPASGRTRASDPATARPGAASPSRRRARSPGSTSASSGNSRRSARQKRRSSRWRHRRGSRESRARARGRCLLLLLRASSLQDPLPHLRGRLARERDRQDVSRLRAGRSSAT